MKIFSKNFFTPEELGRWAFGGLLLATLGSWSVAAWMTLGGWLVDFSKGVEISPVFTGIFIIFVLILWLWKLRLRELSNSACAAYLGKGQGI